MFQDEARFGRSSPVKACWAPYPMRPQVLKQTAREYVYIFGALSPHEGKHDSLILPWADTNAMSLFLKEISRRYPDKHILMFRDQAGWHKSKGLRIPTNIELAFLPLYSPELNPQEQIRDELREKYFGNNLFKSIKEVMNTAVKGLRELEASPATITQLTKRNWVNMISLQLGIK